MNPLTISDWTPNDDREIRLHMASLMSKKIHKALAKIGPMKSMPCLALELAGELIYVEPECTICEHCSQMNPIGLVPDFGHPYSEEQRGAIKNAENANCSFCGLQIKRRKVLWMSTSTTSAQQNNSNDGVEQTGSIDR